MEYKEIMNYNYRIQLCSTPNQPNKFGTKDWVEITDNSRGRYNTCSQIRFTISMLRSSLCDYIDACMLVSGTITVAALAEGGGNNEIQVVFKKYAPFINFMSEINNTQIDNDIDVLIPMYNLIEYSDNYSKASGSLWQYYKDKPALTAAGAFDDFPGKSASFNLNKKLYPLTFS